MIPPNLAHMPEACPLEYELYAQTARRTKDEMPCLISIPNQELITSPSKRAM